jgi:hypothetical protein
MRTKPHELMKLKYGDMRFTEIRINFSDEPDAVLFRYQREANRRFFSNPRRMFRILRDYPKPLWLPIYLPTFFNRVTKGLFTPPPPRCFPEEQPVTVVPQNTEV